MGNARCEKTVNRAMLCFFWDIIPSAIGSIFDIRLFDIHLFDIHYS